MGLFERLVGGGSESDVLTGHVFFHNNNHVRVEWVHHGISSYARSTFRDEVTANLFERSYLSAMYWGSMLTILHPSSIANELYQDVITFARNILRNAMRTSEEERVTGIRKVNVPLDQYELVVSSSEAVIQHYHTILYTNRHGTLVDRRPLTMSNLSRFGPLASKAIIASNVRDLPTMGLVLLAFALNAMGQYYENKGTMRKPGSSVMAASHGFTEAFKLVENL